jgi:hypothetical protein
MQSPLFRSCTMFGGVLVLLAASIAPAAAQTRIFVLHSGATSLACQPTNCDPGRLLEIDVDHRTIASNTPVVHARVNTSGPRLTSDGRYIVWTGTEDQLRPSFLNIVDTATGTFGSIAQLHTRGEVFDMYVHPTLPRVFLHTAFAANITTATPLGFTSFPVGCDLPILEGMSGDGSRLFARCASSYTVVLDTTSGTRVATVSDGNFVQTSNTTGTELFTGRFELGEPPLYRRWDVATGSLLAERRVGAPGDAPDAIHIDPRTGHLWVLLFGRAIQVLDASTLAPIGRIETAARSQMFAAFDPQAPRMFFSSNELVGFAYRTYLHIVDTNALTVRVAGELPVHSRIVGMTLAPAPADSSVALSASLDGRSVSLHWAHRLSNVTSVFVEAGSARGASDLAQMPMTSTATSLVVDAVPPGTYYVRLRINKSDGTSVMSNEVTVQMR